MPISRTILSLCIAFLVFCLPEAVLGQQTSTPSTIRDQRALAIITQSLNAAGGATALSAIQDCSGSGTITYYWSDSPVQGTVNVKSRGLGQLRIDATLADGARSVIANNGSGSVAEIDGSVALLPHQSAAALGSMALPYLPLLAAFQDTSITITYVGLVDHLGKQVYDVRVQKPYAFATNPTGTMGVLNARDFLIDSNSFLVTSVLNSVNITRDGVDAHAFEFSNYQTVNGVAVPFSISETARGQALFTIQLNQVTFNSNLADSDFAQ